MAVEIERKFLVDSTRLILGDAPASHLKQGYLSVTPTVRVRASDTEAWLTIKGTTHGISRSEFEYRIPLPDALELLTLCEDRVLEKTRYRVQHSGRTWEVDHFHGANAGLVLAELELETEDDVFGVPDWVTAEVTGDQRYSNSSLVQYPYGTWRT